MSVEDTEIDTDELIDKDRGDEVLSGEAAEKAIDTPEVEEEVKDSLSEEGEETEEERLEREREEAEEAKKRNIRIPKARFDQVQARARAREQELLKEIEELRGGKKENETQNALQQMRNTIEELQDKYEDMILDGDKEGARKARRQIDEMRTSLIEYQTSVKTEAARIGAIEEMTYNARLATIEAEYPELNPDDEENFDQEKSVEVANLMIALTRSGSSRSAALEQAVRYVMGPPQKEQVSEAGRKLAELRAKKARERAAAANKKQPPSTTGVGLDSDKAGKGGDGTIDVMRLSQEKFAKLEDEELARLRGDAL